MRTLRTVQECRVTHFESTPSWYYVVERTTANLASPSEALLFHKDGLERMPLSKEAERLLLAADDARTE